MSNKQLPAIILKTNYRVGSSKGKSYNKFIKYISSGKNENDITQQGMSKENLFQNYLDYMSINQLKSDTEYKRECEETNDIEF